MSLVLGLLPCAVHAQTPFDITDPTPRQIRIEVEALNGIAVTSEGTLPGSGALPDTLQPNPIANFTVIRAIVGSWSVSGNTGTITIPASEMEAFVNSKFGGAFITAVPGSFPPSTIIIDTATRAASWTAKGRVKAFNIEGDFAVANKTAPGPWVFDAPLFDGGPFDDVSISGTTGGIEVQLPQGIPHFCSETFHNASGHDSCGDLGSPGVGFAPSYPYLPAFGLIRMTGPVGIAGVPVFGGYLHQDLGDQRWTEVAPVTCGNGTIDDGEQCDDGNGVDGDCCSNACQAAANGTSCSDGAVCTTGDACSAGVCVGGPTVPASCGNEYLCYKAKLSKGAPKFVKSTIPVSDTIESGQVDILKPFGLCPPGDVAGGGIVDAATHLLGYATKAAKGQPKHVKRTGIVVTDEFGTLTVDTIKPDRLLLPAAKSLAGPASALPGGSGDSHRCYAVKLSKGAPKFPKNLVATVADQFENRTYSLKKPTRLCYPADASASGIGNAATRLMCYKVAKVKGQAKHQKRVGLVQTRDLLGPLALDTIVEDELCVHASTAP